MPTVPRVNAQLSIVFIVVSIGFMGISLPFPIFTPMLLNDSYSIFKLSYSGSVLLGLALAFYPIGQFVGSPILGSASDFLGRKKILTFSLIGTACGYLLSAFSIHIGEYYLLLLSRFFTGFFEGNIAIAQAVVSDISKQGGKERGFGLINCAVALGYIVGPFLGSIFSNQIIFSWTSYATPFILGSILSITGAVIVKTCFVETYGYKNINTPLNYSLNGILIKIKIFLACLNISKVRNAVILYLLLYVGIDFFYEFYPLFFIGQWNFTSLDIAIYSAVYTFPYAISQIFLVPHVSTAYNTYYILMWASLFMFIILTVFSLLPERSSLYVTLPLLGILISFCSTSTAVLISNSVDDNNQGKIFGFVQSFRLLGLGIITVVGGWLGVFSCSLPMLCGASAILIGFIYLLFTDKKY